VIQAVIFDLFETLVTEASGPVRRASSLARELGVDDDAYRRQWRSQRRDVVLGRCSFREVLAHIVRTLGGTVNEELTEQLRSERVVQKTTVLRSVEADVLAAIGTLRARGFKLAVVTNSMPEDVAGWDSSPLSPFFDVATFSCSVGLAKPDPKIYLLTCQELRVSPDGALFIGDGGDDEIAGARAAGLAACRALWFVSGSPNSTVTRASPGLWRTADVVHATIDARV
jgi:HAD superfamily hydrolase (TIGR01509 family)